MSWEYQIVQKQLKFQDIQGQNCRNVKGLTVYNEFLERQIFIIMT